MTKLPKPKLTKIEVRAVVKSIKEWFRTHKEDTVRVKLGPLGTYRFHREDDVKLQVLGING